MIGFRLIPVDDIVRVDVGASASWVVGGHFHITTPPNGAHPLPVPPAAFGVTCTVEDPRELAALLRSLADAIDRRINP